MEEHNTIKVLLVEDQDMPRQLFEMIIKGRVNGGSKYELLYSIDSASVAHMYCDRYDIDLIIMDVVMTDGSNGLDAAERIKTAHPDIKIIIVTSMPEVSFIQRARDIGMDSFWYKGRDANEILDIMDRTIAGEHVFPEDTPVVLMGETTSDHFTAAELAVLRELIKGGSNKEIGEALSISETTVRTHISSMLSKTGFSNRTELAIKARIGGLVI